jgi:N-methylhydantoinase B
MDRAFDPILVEVIKNELAAITEEMAIAVWKTGRSAMVKTGDFATALCDGQGRLIGQGYAAPFQLAFFIEMMPYILNKCGNSFKPGDVIVVNDPYAGITHMPDVAIIAPAFWQGKLVAFTLSYSHHTDIGGRFPGGFSSQCTETFEEGLRLPIVKLYDGGTRNDALLETILANVRVSDEWLGDVEAKIAGCWRGEQELKALLDKYGVETYQASCDYLIDYAERATRAAIRAIPPGAYVYNDTFEDDGFGTDGAALPIQLTLRIAGDTLTADFTGTSPQARGAINLPLSMTKATVYGAVKSVVSPDVLTNVGFVRPINVIAPLGTLVNPRFPAAVGGRAPLFFRVFDMLFRALAQALPEKVPVPGEGGDVLHFTGQKADGSHFAVMDIFFGGWGGRPMKDGIDGVAPMAFGSYGTIPAELLEREFPLVVDGFGYVPDTAGAGKHRGSLSIYKQWRFLQPGKVMVRTNRLLRASDGMNGGAPGSLSTNILNPEEDNLELPRKAHMHLEVKPGDRIYHVVSGSGGHGHPWEREPEKVLTDVKDDKLTLVAAREHYGVVIDPQSLTIDWEKTTALRQKRTDPAIAAG